ncbi:MAG: DUF819 family protein [Clostridia bacterium]|nr:DUF819 family protein [Clostridia bacterium]
MIDTVLTVIAVIAIFTLPIFIVWLTRKFRLLGAVGAIVICYLVGFAFSAIGLSGHDYDKGLTTTIAYVLVALSIPLVLFSINLKSVKTLAKGTVIGYSLCIVSAVIVAVAMFFITRLFMEGTDKLAAMTIGLYTGGTPNLNAIGISLKAGSENISAANLSDSIVGGLYFLLIISVMPKVYGAILKRREKRAGGKKGARNAAVSDSGASAAADANPINGTREASADEQAVTVESAPVEEPKKDDYTFGFSIKDKKSVLKLIGAFFLAVACLGVGALLEFLIEGTVGENLLYILIAVSVGGVALSFITPVREIKGQYPLGMYLILFFSIALAMSIDWTVFLTDILPTLAFFAVAQISVVLIHLLLCKIFRIDGDTALITSTAGVYGPPFIAPAAKACRRPDLIAPGIICASLGLAIGTVLGYGVGMLFMLV